MIDSFSGSYSFLSNFYDMRGFGGVQYAGFTFPTSENAYQAAKCANPCKMSEFIDVSAREAKQLGQRVQLRSDWNIFRLRAMQRILHNKFSTEPLRGWLIATGSERLVEGNHWGDTYWGVCDGVGQNHLGQLLMELRMELISNDTAGDA